MKDLRVILRLIRVFQSVPFHQSVQIDHGKTAVFWIIAEFGGSQSLFQNALQDHPVERPMAHVFFMLYQIGLGVRGKINRLPLTQAVMRNQSFAPLLGPVSERFFVDMGAPQFNNRAILKYAP